MATLELHQLREAPSGNASGTVEPLGYLELRDAYLERPWNPYLTGTRVSFGVEHLARQIGADAELLAAELKESQPALASLLIAPLLGEHRGRPNQEIPAHAVAAISQRAALMRVPQIRAYVDTANEVLRGADGPEPSRFNNDNTAGFLLLRQRLEDVLVDLHLTERVYNVRPCYAFSPESTPEATRFSLGDLLRFTFSDRHELSCRVLSGGEHVHASKCLLFRIEIDCHGMPPDPFKDGSPLPRFAALGRYDPADDTIDPQSEAGVLLERALLQYRDLMRPSAPLFFLSWLSVDDGSRTRLELCPFPAAHISILPEDIAEMVILKSIEKRAAEITVLPERMHGRESGVPFDLLKLPTEPFFEQRFRYGSGWAPVKTLSVQEWGQIVERLAAG